MGDLFDALEAIEQGVILDGENEGRKQGEKRQFEEGFVFGWQQACHIQSELGLIQGFLGSVLENSSTLKPKEVIAITKILNDVKTCNEWDPSDEVEIESKLQFIHAKTKLILKKMNIHSTILDRDIDNEF